MSSVIATIDSYLQTVSTDNGTVSVNLSDAQSEFIIDNLVTFLQNSDPNSTVKTNFLSKVIIPAAIKVYLPYTVILVGTLVGLGYYIGRARK